jgi:hypothetical protein
MNEDNEMIFVSTTDKWGEKLKINNDRQKIQRNGNSNGKEHLNFINIQRKRKIKRQ